MDCGVRYGMEILPLHLLIDDDGDVCDGDDSGGDSDGTGIVDSGGGDCGGDCGGGSSNVCANRPPKKSQAIFRFNGGSTPEPVK